MPPRVRTTRTVSFQTKLPAPSAPHMQTHAHRHGHQGYLHMQRRCVMNTVAHARLPSQAAAVRHEHRRARLSSTSTASAPQRPSPQQPATPPSAPPFFGVSFPRLPRFTSPSTSATRGQAQHRRQARRHPLHRHVQGQHLCHRLLQQQRERPPGVRPRHTSRWCTPTPP